LAFSETIIISAVNNLFTSTGAANQKLHGYERRYTHHQLRKRSFRTRGEAEADLRRVHDEIVIAPIRSMAAVSRLSKPTFRVEASYPRAQKH
jgi:hypothetical protein